MKLSYDLHIHSALSPCADNDMTPGNIVGMAYLNGLDIIAITDHQSCANVSSAIKAADCLAQEKGRAPLVLPGMELECGEGFHLLAYFPTIDAALDFESYIYSHRLLIPNRPEIFGEQLLIDANDQIQGHVENLLLTACDLSSGLLIEEIIRRGGFSIPAHVDRTSYSMLASLGCIPQDYPFNLLEISDNCNQGQLFSDYPDLINYSFVQSSDAHHLVDIHDPGKIISLSGITEDTIDGFHLLQALREKSFK